MTRQASNIVNFQCRQEAHKQVLERLFSEHGEALRSFLRGRMGGSPELEDIVQDVFVRLARMEDLHQKLVADHRDSRAFIFTMANHLLVDRQRRSAVRRQYQEAEFELAQEEQVETTPEIIVSDTQQLDVVERAILSLPPVWRQAFVLNRFDNKSYPQIAAEMGVSVKQVEKYMSSALNRIREVARTIREME